MATGSGVSGDAQQRGHGFLGGIVGGDGHEFLLPALAALAAHDGECDGHGARLTGCEGLLADRSGEAIATRAQRGEAQRLRTGVTKREFRDRFLLAGSDAELRRLARPRDGRFAGDTDEGGQGRCP
jgi:hypothetical protein